MHNTPPSSLLTSYDADATRLTSLHKKLQFSAGALAIASGLELLALANRYTVVTSILDGSFRGTDSEIANVDRLVAVAVMLGLISLLTLVIMLIIWVNRTTRFLLAQNVATAKSPGWAIGSFFVPIANIFLVYGTFKDLTSGLGRIYPQVTYARYSPFRMFWVAIVVGGLVGRASTSSNTEIITLEAYKSSESLSALSAILVLAGAILCVRAFGRFRQDIQF